ncbi:holo-ACP synthase [Xylanimonas ulmi]|uniref:Holo-[acyl-carrier-protein] synthase n=1 Tax=Xylanimonas ulmi TaxID=228973 RepID=A0A4Q7M2X6_9MICO|nr:4'-phosphopantetheinyl transferase superfamily protein [Xylanibacterium ulmi]RZS61844.1 holo-[acyl-carrier-protein] synthase [Xylanibacterium ulmi]
MLHGAGIDVADVARIARLVERRGPAFTTRWFAAAEIAQCERAAVTTAAFAGVYAAKEAVWKALAIRAWPGPVPWRWICVTESAPGRWSVRLGGPVADAAQAAGVGEVRVHIAQGGAVATAVALATRAVSGAPPA